MSNTSTQALAGSSFVHKVAWKYAPGQQRAVRELLRIRPPRGRVRQLVRRFSWERVAHQVVGCHAQMIEGAPPD